MSKKKPPVLFLLNKHLLPVLGARRYFFIAGLVIAAPGYRRRFRSSADDNGLKEFKKTFLLVGALYHELVKIVGEEVAIRTTTHFLTDVANAVQRNWYIPPTNSPRSFEAFHDEHEHQMQHGLIRHNVHDEIIADNNQYQFHITRCLFHEAFSDMGFPWLTEVFCHSDEVVFNEYSPDMSFHRGDDKENTIARGAKQCTFIFRKLN
ncbi:L-2-amino-thiazoline-4-carboxylic acid hydrolase [Paenibacillus sp. BR2-3]|uniref:L-2-amino-thiazoline-4-carboxylic acid hydrolase n=1 Tax=Paenibacillus sp. BR2-3 TaxID=3048494 RepID=UPI00397733AB